MTKILTGKGVNAQRKLFSGLSNHDDELTDLNTSAPVNFMLRAVVVEVVFDLAALSSRLKELAPDMVHPELLESMPRNSIVARVISGAADKRNSTLTVFYPTLSHTHQPLKPGEQVWVFFEDPNNHDYGYWLSRITEPADIEDPNFTHADRKFIDQRQPTTVERLEEAKQLQGLSPEAQARLRASSGKGPQFPNGGDTEESYSLSSIDAYEQIDQESVANKVITKEPVPRYNKRPGDWAAEGSNNSLFVLGEDRTGAAANPDSSGKPDKDKSGESGMFDLVLGRGIGKDRRLPAPGASGAPTAPPVIQNARGKLETDKELSKNNTNEGDPDFEFDAVRFYGAMNTDVDGNFGKPLPNLNSGKVPEKIDKGAAVIAKANHVRVIAREDGTIRIVKEGTADDESGKGRAVIIIEKDGTIMIDGPHIIMGSGIEKSNGAGTQVYLGRDATESIVLGDTLKQLLTSHSTAVQTALDQVFQGITDFCIQMAIPPNNLGNFAIPIAGLTALPPVLAGVTTAAKTQFDADNLKFQQDLIKILSKIGKTK